MIIHMLELKLVCHLFSMSTCLARRTCSNTMITYQFFQKLELLENDEFNQLIIILIEASLFLSFIFYFLYMLVLISSVAFLKALALIMAKNLRKQQFTFSQCPHSSASEAPPWSDFTLNLAGKAILTQSSIKSLHIPINREKVIVS